MRTENMNATEKAIEAINQLANHEGQRVELVAAVIDAGASETLAR
jgi:hypothetical protein